MTPIHIISRDMSTAQQVQKMNRDEYRRLIENEQKARERAERYKKK